MTQNETNSSRHCCMSSENSMFSTSSCQEGEKNQLPMDERSDVAVPGPSCSSSSSSPSQGPCAPESSTKRSIDQSALSLDSFAPQNIKNVEDQHTLSNAETAQHEQSTQPALIRIVEATKPHTAIKTPKAKDIELELRADCAHALSLCAFQDDLEMEMNW